MAKIGNYARDVETGDPITTGSVDIYGPDGSLITSVAVDGVTGRWAWQANGSPGKTRQVFDAAGQVKVVEGDAYGQAGNWFEAELERILQLFSSGVISGMAVTAPGGMNVQVGLGDLINLGVLHPIYTAESVAISAAHASNPRIDVVVSRLTRTGTFAGRVVLAVIAGTAAASPTKPALTNTADTNDVEVCTVTVPAAASSIVSGNISVLARPTALPPIADAAITQAKLAKPSVGTPELLDSAVTATKLAAGTIVPGLVPGLINNYWISARNVVGGDIQTTAIGAGVMYASPVYIPGPTTITGIAAESNLSRTKRLGIYRAGSNGMPTTLLHDAGSTTGTLSSLTGLSVAAPAGWYWLALLTGTSGDYQGIRGDALHRDLMGSIGPGDAAPYAFIQALYAGGTGVALPNDFPASPGVANGGPQMWIRTAGT